MSSRRRDVCAELARRADFDYFGDAFDGRRRGRHHAGGEKLLKPRRAQGRPVWRISE